MSTRLRPRLGAALVAATLVAAFAASQSTAVHAAPAYQDGFIAFGGGGNPGWTVIDADGSNSHFIAASGGGFDPTHLGVTTVSYSPDAKLVAFAALDAESQAPSLWVANADGTSAHQIAYVSTLPSRLAWSPDSSTVLFGSGTIQMVPADGSRPPVTAFSDPGCTDADPQVTTRGYIFFSRSCPSESALAVYRPGDLSPSDVSISQELTSPKPSQLVSPDGSRVVSVSGGYYFTYFNIAEVGNGASYLVTKIPVLVGALAFGPSGHVIYAYPDLVGGGSKIEEVADSPNAVPRTVAADLPNVTFIDWVNGSSNLAARPAADRVGGTDRLDTAIKASQWSFDGHDAPGRRAAVAVLARADTFPDALAGTALAIQMGGPLLLTPSGTLDSAVGAELTRILSPGSTVYLLGGTAALSPAVSGMVQQLGFVPTRLGGTDRYGTAVAIATAISGTRPKSVLLATGTDFPDALTAGAGAGQERYDIRGVGDRAGGVVLLTDGSTMPAATLAYLKSLPPHDQAVYAIGGPAAAAVDSAFVPPWPGLIRLVGVDRYDTAAKVATSALFGNGTPGRYTVAGVATGLDFPDAMSGGGLAGSQDGPLLLAGSNGLTAQEEAIMKAGRLSDVAVIGGPSAVSTKIFTDVADTAFGPNTWDAFINRPAPPLP